MPTNSWVQQCYARMLVDNHITEESPAFMSAFDPRQYASLMKKAGVQSAMVSACCHNGNCYYPTKVGHMHRNLNGRDVFGETIALLRSAGIVPLAYYTVVYHFLPAKEHPSWRMENAIGKQQSGRSWCCCPNSLEYRKFAKQQLAEILAYAIDGIFIDMTFWPGVCVCHNCRSRYRAEVGKEIPLIIDWENADWIQFNRFRELWITEFAQALTASIKNIKPNITVAHQFAPVLLGWWWGQAPGIAMASDYTSGDFYGGKYQQQLATKVLCAFSESLPYEFFTTCNVSLHDHTSMKSEAEMVCSAATTLANAGAYCLIDAINPDGTLEVRLYERLRRVNHKLAPFLKKMRESTPYPLADIGLYFSMASNVSLQSNSQSLTKILRDDYNFDALTNIPVIKEILGTSIVLTKNHYPYRIITDRTKNWDNLKTLIVNNAAFLADDEVQRIRDFVAKGGTLIATGLTSLFNPEGRTSGDFRLADVFGVSFSGAKTKRIHYLVIDKHNLYVSGDGQAPIVKARSAKPLAYLVEPLFPPDDSDRYASYHSNPPGPMTGHPGLSLNDYGKGKCLYLASSLLAIQQEAQQSFGDYLLGQRGLSDPMITTDAPPCVELTLLQGKSGNSVLICLINYQLELPNVPVHDIHVSFGYPYKTPPVSCILASNSTALQYSSNHNKVSFALKRLETIEMVELIW